MNRERLGIGFVGSGFITRFHLHSLVAVRDVDVLGIWSPNTEHAEEAAALARRLDVGEARVFPSITSMVESPEVGALWICGPNHKRIENMEEIAGALASGKGELAGVACEKPLARNVAEANRVVELVREAGLLHGYLENQVFAEAVVRGREIAWRRGAALTGRPYLARAAEEHSGPHTAWFWQGELQGGGVLNDMMCHSAEVGRFLLTEPGTPRTSIVCRRVTAHIASLKWTRPEYAQRLSEISSGRVDYRRAPAEDFASATFEYEAEDGSPLIAEASTSWSYVGAGLRLTMELLGPEYSLSISSLDSELQVFFSRQVRGDEGEDLVEKQNAETGLMPVIPNEAVSYGYAAQNRHMVQSFLQGCSPRLTFDDGLEVSRLLMAAYMSAEQGRTLEFPPPGVEEFIPGVARGEWKPWDSPAG